MLCLLLLLLPADGEYQLIQILSTEKVIFSVFDSKKTHHISNSECVDCVESLQVKKADVVRYDTT